MTLRDYTVKLSFFHLSVFEEELYQIEWRGGGTDCLTPLIHFFISPILHILVIMMLTSRKKRKSRKLVLYLLNYLKGTGIPCNVTLYYRDEDLQISKKRGVHINLNKIPRHIIKGKDNYHLRIKVDGLNSFFLKSFYFGSYNPVINKMYIEELEKEMTDKYGEYITNHKRDHRLKDILSDPNPPKLI
jgi:hypothetical protein